MRKSGLSDDALLRAVSEMQRGLVDADLGGSLFKKRLALPGQGKRGGARTIVATNRADRWFFLFGFAKNERTDVDEEALRVLQKIARDLLGFDGALLAAAMLAGEIEAVSYETRQS